MLVDCRKCSIPFTPTRGQWATEPNTGAAQGVSSPVSRPEPVQPRSHQAPRVFQLRETPQAPGPDPPPPLLPAYGPQPPQPLLDVTQNGQEMPQQAPLGGRYIRAWARPAYLEDYVTYFHASGLYVFLSYGLSATSKLVSLSSSSYREG